MTVSTELVASPRDVVGKTSKRLAAKGQLPAVLYGVGRDPMPVSIDRHDFELFAANHAAGATLVELKLEGTKKPINAMIREVQHSPIKGNIVHVDFQEVSMNKAVHASVALSLVNDPAGVRAGGVLTVNIHELTVEAKPGDLPETLEHDVSALEVGDVLHVSDITAPKGVVLIDDPELVIASVTAPTVAEEPELEAAEPELIGEKSEEE